MFSIRGKPVTVLRHAMDGLMAERPPISIGELLEVLEDPDHAGPDARGRRRVRKWTGARTVLVSYAEDEREIKVVSCSATRRRL